jgi:hypothetical protein
LARLNKLSGENGAAFASLFVVDGTGTMVADAYAADVTTRSVGRNYSWRTYFHGGPEDLDPAANRSQPVVISTPHLSAVFKSSTTEKWKVAISTPIYDASESSAELLGVLALTIDVGDFGVFRSREETTDYVAVLIDNRQGERMGTILQHPLFRKQPPADDYRLSEAQLAGVHQQLDYRYQDPLAQADGGGSYAGEWIAAAEAVNLPRRSNAGSVEERTDLLVLVQVNADTATAPVRQLSKRLMHDGILALVLIVLAIVVLWVIVSRISGLPSRQRGRRRRNPRSLEISPWREASTMTASHRSSE